jgi:hypothetical protein
MTKPKFNAQWITHPSGSGGFSYASEQYYLKHEVDAYIDKLFKDAVRVYCKRDIMMGLVEWSQAQQFNGSDTHQALLIGIEPLEKKECEHEAQLVWSVMDRETGFKKVQCSKCGKKLKAKWEVAK